MHEARLADAHLAAHLDAAQRGIAGESAAQPAQLGLAPREGREAPRTLDREARAMRPLAHQLVHPDGLGEAAEGARAEVDEVEVGAAAARRVFADEDLAGSGRGLQPSGEAHRRSLRGVVPAELVPDRADPDEARADADPHREGQPEARAHRVGEGARALAHLEGRAQRARRVVAARARRAEERHEAVARGTGSRSRPRGAPPREPARRSRPSARGRPRGRAPRPWPASPRRRRSGP